MSPKEKAKMIEFLRCEVAESDARIKKSNELTGPLAAIAVQEEMTYAVSCMRIISRHADFGIKG